MRSLPWSIPLIAAAGVLLGTGLARAQSLSVERTYVPRGQPLLVRVDAATDQASQPAPGTKLAIELRRAPDASLIDRAEVKPGPVRLDEVFESLRPATPSRPLSPPVVYAQLTRDGTAIGPAVVLQPMRTPERSSSADQRGLSIKFAPVGPAYVSGYRVYVDRRVLLETTLGELEFALRPDAAPNTVWNFRELVAGGLYDGTEFHRVIGSPIPGKGFMIQGGDPLGAGVGGPGYAIELEPSPIEHDFGVLSMARLSAPDTAGSQFFVVLSREAARPLDGAYAAFGHLVRGAEVLRALGSVRTGPEDRPLDPPVITRARLIDAPPFEGVMPEREATGATER